MKSAEIIKAELLIALVLKCTTGENAEPLFTFAPGNPGSPCFPISPGSPWKGNKDDPNYHSEPLNINTTNFTEKVKEQGFLDMMLSVRLLKGNNSQTNGAIRSLYQHFVYQTSWVRNTQVLRLYFFWPSNIDGQKLLGIEDEIVCEVVLERGINTTCEKVQIALKHKSVCWAEQAPCWFVPCDLQKPNVELGLFQVSFHDIWLPGSCLENFFPSLSRQASRFCNHCGSGLKVTGTSMCRLQTTLWGKVI